MFLLSSVRVYWGEGAWQTEVAQDQTLKWSLTQFSLTRAHYEESN